jgi:hypothetical protein
LVSLLQLSNEIIKYPRQFRCGRVADILGVKGISQKIINSLDYILSQLGGRLRCLDYANYHRRHSIYDSLIHCCYEDTGSWHYCNEKFYRTLLLLNAAQRDTLSFNL